MYDPNLKYCPKCKDEYVAEAVQCAGCEVELLNGDKIIEMEEGLQKKRDSRAGTITPEDDIVTIHRSPMQDMKRIESLLEKENIAVLVLAEDKGGCKSCGPPTLELSVRREDAMDALEIIQQEQDRTTGFEDHNTAFVDNVFNPQAMEVQCPACGASFPPTGNECPECGLCF